MGNLRCLAISAELKNAAPIDIQTIIAIANICNCLFYFLRLSNWNT